MIRFWDTSALVKIYNAGEAGHREAVRLLHGPRVRRVRPATSMIVVVELVSAIVRRVRDPDLVVSALRQLDSFNQVEMTARHRDLATRLARTGIARGADTVIAAQALALAEATSEGLEFVTADEAQARLVRGHAESRQISVCVVQLPL